MDERETAINALLSDGSIGPEDTFDLRCHACGRCCRDCDDILLNSEDLFNLATWFDITTRKAAEKYCHAFIGKNTKMPLLRLEMQGPERVCPLLQPGGCRLQNKRPTVCRLFPLGRATFGTNDSAVDVDSSQLEQKYLLQQQVGCSGKPKTITVRQHLRNNGFSIPDWFYREWSRAFFNASGLLSQLRDAGLTDSNLKVFQDSLASFFYYDYDTQSDFQAQFFECMHNLEELIVAVEKLTGTTIYRRNSRQEDQNNG